MCMVFEFGDHKLVYRDSAGPMSQEEEAYFSSIDGVDAPVAQYVDDVVAGRMTAKEMMDVTLARETKAEME